MKTNLWIKLHLLLLRLKENWAYKRIIWDYVWREGHRMDGPVLYYNLNQAIKVLLNIPTEQGSMRNSAYCWYHDISNGYARLRQTEGSHLAFMRIIWEMALCTNKKPILLYETLSDEFRYAMFKYMEELGVNTKPLNLAQAVGATIDICYPEFKDKAFLTKNTREYLGMVALKRLYEHKHLLEHEFPIPKGNHERQN